MARADAKHIRLTISDEGPGFGAEQGIERFEAAGHLGLAGMRERIASVGGDVRLRTAPNAGVTIDIEVPLSEATSS